MTGDEFAKSIGYTDLDHLNGKISWEGFSYWLDSYQSFSGVPKNSEIADLLFKYERARDELYSALEEMGVNGEGQES
jgi:hypothetical protein